MNERIVELLHRINKNGWIPSIILDKKLKIEIRRVSEVHQFTKYIKTDGSEEEITFSNLELVLTENVISQIILYRKIKMDMEIGYTHKVKREDQRGMFAICYHSRENRVLIFSEYNGGFDSKSVSDIDEVMELMDKVAPISNWSRV